MSDPDRGRATGGDGLETSVDRRSLLIRTGLTAMAAVSASVAGASTGFVERMLRTRFTELSADLSIPPKAVRDSQPWVTRIVAVSIPEARSRFPKGGAPMPSLIWIATRGVMEILGLVP